METPNPSVAPREEKKAVHTLGPWRLVPNSDPEYGDTQRIVGADLVSPGLVFMGLPECEANAHLIAAAPDLLEALETMLDAESYVGDESDCECGEFDGSIDDPKAGLTKNCRHTKARAAIAKAGGK